MGMPVNPGILRDTYVVRNGESGKPALFASGPVPVAMRRGKSLFYEGTVYRIEGEKVAGRSKLAIAERLLDSYLEKGEAVFERTIGEFSLVVVDGERGIAFRSLTSPHQIYYTDTKLSNHLIALTDDDSSLEREYLLDFLFRKSPGYSQSVRTPFRGIRRIRAGEILRHGSRGMWGRTKKVSASQLTGRTDYSQKAEDFGPMLREILQEAVSDRLATAGEREVVCELSGGLDSSFICSMVARTGRPVSAYMFSYPQNPSHRFSEGCASAVAEKYPNISFDIYPPEFFLPHDLAASSVYSDEPSHFFWQGSLFCSKMATVLPERSVIFSGIGSDQLFLRQATVLPWLLRQGRLIEYFKKLAEMAPAKSRGSFNLFVQSVLALVPAYHYLPWMDVLRRVPFHLFSFEDINAQYYFLGKVPWLKKQPGYDHRAALKSEREEHVGLFGGDHEIRASLEGAAVPQQSLMPCLSARGIDYQMPFYDQRLLRFVYGSVSWHLIHDWNRPYKHLLREAQKEVVADLARNRPKNEFHFDGFLGKLIGQNEELIRALVSDRSLLDTTLVDRDQLNAALEKRLLGVSSDSGTRSLTSLIFYLLWNRNFESARKNWRVGNSLMRITPEDAIKGLTG